MEESPASQEEVTRAAENAINRLLAYEETLAAANEDWWKLEDWERHVGAVFLDTLGCFHCGRIPEDVKKLMTCTRCCVARYCSRECQKKDWKINHGPKSRADGEGVCQVLKDNREDDVPLPLNLASVGYLDPNGDFSMAIKLRTRSFFRIMQQRNGDDKLTYLTASVVPRFGKLYVNGSVRWMTETSGVIDVQFVICEPVDEGPEAERLIYSFSAGRLAATGRENTMQALERYARLANSVGASIFSVTVGRGLTEEEVEILRRMRNTGCRIDFGIIISTDYMLA